MTKHSELFSPSKAERRLNCPGSARLEAGLPDIPSPYAEEGSAAHFLAERCLNMDCKAERYLGRRIVRVPGKFGFSLLQAGSKRNDGWEITREMAEAVQTYLDFVLGHQPDRGTRLIEQRLRITEDCFGTADHIYAVPFGPLYVDDYKHGVGVTVSPEWNPQALTYALGAVYASPFDHTVVRVSIIQPRTREGEAIKSWELPVAELYKWRDTVLLPGIERCKDPDAPLASGPHCKFCKAYGACPEVNKEVTAMMQIHAPTGLPAPALLTNDQLAMILEKKSLAESWLSEVAALALRKIESGESIPGWKVVSGRGSRDWESAEVAAQNLESVLGQDAYERKLLSPAKAETAFKENGLDPKVLAGLIKKVEGKPTLAPADDKRAPLPTSAERAFAAIPARGPLG